MAHAPHDDTPREPELTPQQQRDRKIKDDEEERMKRTVVTNKDLDEKLKPINEKLTSLDKKFDQLDIKFALTGLAALAGPVIMTVLGPLATPVPDAQNAKRLDAEAKRLDAERELLKEKKRRF